MDLLNIDLVKEITSYSSLFIFSSTSIVISVFTGLIIFYFSFTREERASHKMVLRQWGLAFLFFSWVQTPIVIVASGVTIVVSDLAPIFGATSVSFFVALALFYRGAMSFFTTNKLWLNTFSILFFGGSYALMLIAMSLFRVGVMPIAIVMFLLFTAIIVLVIAATFRYRKELNHASYADIGKAGATIFVLGWFIFSILNFYIIVALTRYPIDAWFLALVSNRWLYMGFALAHLQMAFGLYLAGFHKDVLPRPEAVDHPPNKQV